MSLKKFNRNDILLNTMKAHPKCEFFIFNGQVNYNSVPEQSGAFSAQVRNVPPGHISLYEYNIDKITGSGGGVSRDNPHIRPFITKDSARASFQTAVGTTTKDEWDNTVGGETLYGAYPLSASITRELITNPSSLVFDSNGNINFTASSGDSDYSTYTKHFLSLRNRLDFYAARSIHYKVSSSYGNKDDQTLNLISIPSIFYGTTIQTGSVSLKWYVTGSLVGELRDVKQNGELIEFTGSLASGINNKDIVNTNKVAGVVLYDEGIILLTGSYKITDDEITLGGAGTAFVDSNPKWTHFGAGAQDGVSSTSPAGMDVTFASASFNLSFKGTTETQVVTMFAHAKRGEVNYSNNPTFIKYGQDQINYTSSHVYEENSERLLANTVSSSYSEYSASFKRQVYVSKVAIYDDHKNLIGVATLANPVLKEEDQDLAFKLRCDF